MKTVAHVLLFLLAGVVFFLGLGIGLSQNPAVGTLLWVAAAAIAVANGIWMSRSGRGQGRVRFDSFRTDQDVHHGTGA